MWARIDNAIVVELTDINPSKRFHPSLKWVECDNSVDIGDVYDKDTKQFTKPQTPDKQNLTPGYTYKTDVWDRATEDEAALLDSALISATPKERRMWQDCLRIEHSSEYFAQLRQTMVDALGDERRVDELLAPSEG